MLLIAQMTGQLRMQAGLQHPLHQLRQKPALPGQLHPAFINPVHQLIQEPLVEELINRLLRRPLRTVSPRHNVHPVPRFLRSVYTDNLIPPKPLMLLSDNSLAFTGRKLGSVVLFEKNLISLGIKPIWSSSRHPQTCGKNERGHHTARRWLSRRPPAVSLAELQQLLDRYREKFNHRPHQALHGATPLEQRAASTRTTPRPGLAPSYPTTVSTHTATSHGAIGVSGVIVGLGVEYAGQHLTCFNTNDHVLIFYKHHLVHEFTIDRSHNYQHPLRPRGGKRRTLPR